MNTRHMSRVTDPEHRKSVITVAFYCLEFLLFCHIEFQTSTLTTKSKSFQISDFIVARLPTKLECKPTIQVPSYNAFSYSKFAKAAYNNFMQINCIQSDFAEQNLKLALTNKLHLNDTMQYVDVTFTPAAVHCGRDNQNMSLNVTMDILSS